MAGNRLDDASFCRTRRRHPDRGEIDLIGPKRAFSAFAVSGSSIANLSIPR